MDMKRVVVTGLGAITPLGHTIDEYWNALINGVSGAGPITRFDVSDYKTTIACEVKDFDPTKWIDKADVKRMDLFTQYGVAAAVDAVDDSGITFENCDTDRVAVITASGIGGMTTFEQQHSLLEKKGPRRISPLFIPMMIGDILAGQVAIRWGLRGPNYGVVSACASSTHAIGTALMTLRAGMADVAVTGGAEATITPMALGGFNALQALSTRNDDPTTASRPFDKDRDGFVMGEGGGMLILETLEHAEARGARIYGELLGFGSSADAYNLVAPLPEGDGAALSMAAALRDAGVKPEDVDHVNTHGTATPSGDGPEINAVKKVFGEHAQKMAINSTKSMTGHLLGAAGVVEAISVIKALYHGIVPPSINVFEQDPEVDVPIQTELNHKRDIQVGLSNTFGFGGHNATLIMKKW